MKNGNHFPYCVGERSLKPHSIVFSTWRLTLDIVEAGLDQSSIPSVRFDGKVPQKDRQNLVDKFRNDPSIRVMLLTLSCGAAG
jgi:SWI/SNF-related matrix-associated actin-dependent regulator of chromatin subfamily A3